MGVLFAEDKYRDVSSIREKCNLPFAPLELYWRHVVRAESVVTDTLSGSMWTPLPERHGKKRCVIETQSSISTASSTMKRRRGSGVGVTHTLPHRHSTARGAGENNNREGRWVFSSATL